MSRSPACLQYLAIYNPTLDPVKTEGDEFDEDAEEQAHILFYTSRERAVSRDRMLRQIGLTKALVNFSGLFDPNNPCESVHSQSRRMVMVSPEPNFWINASIELPKKVHQTSKTAVSKGKTKGKEKEAPIAAAPTFDHEEGGIHDMVLQAQLLQGYQKFKMLHGSFVSILSDLGQEALELQLERFFTVWAWSWNLEEQPYLLDTLGAPIHPYFSVLIPLLDGYSSVLPEHVIPVMFTPSNILPSTRYASQQFPAVLVHHLASLIPPPSPPAPDDMSASIDTIKALKLDSSSKAAQPTAASLFGLSTIEVNMPDVGNWKWPGYLTFGKGSSSSAPKPSTSDPSAKVDEAQSKPPETAQQPQPEGESTQKPPPVDVDPEALRDALTSDARSVSLQPAEAPPGDDNQEVTTSQDTDEGKSVAAERLSHLSVDSVSSSPMSATTLSPDLFRTRAGAPPPPTPPEFSMLRVHLAFASEPSLTKKRNVYYHIKDGFMLTLIGIDDVEEGSGVTEDDLLALAAEHAIDLFATVALNIQRVSESEMADSLPSVAKILQPSDRFAISTGQYSVSSPGFSSNSSHLYNARQLLKRDPAIFEVFSRGQNPQHWHISKRGLSTAGDSADEDANSAAKGEMFLEVFRKEASLPDVDNVLASILRKSGVVESGLV
ncbi:hypothetical protein BKA70DRAFT_1254338 [Coprinopsis sp. MPI-PUGE-AT-0042]|nr:hypothetical protein BKA70DRAFT_1254338 [Coprinopsis sp. MPI-PUGE-AT-0042]